MPRLPTVLKSVPNTRFAKWCIAVARTAQVASPRPYVATEHTTTCSTVKMTQLPNAFGEQSLPTMLLSHVQHEAMIRGGNVITWVRAALCTAEVLSGLLFRPWVSPGLPTVGTGGAGKAMVAAGSPRFADFGLLSSRSPGCSGLSLQLH